jgi:proline-specific peptidase
VLACRPGAEVAAIIGGQRRAGEGAEGLAAVPGGQVWYAIHGAGAPGVPLLCLHGGPGIPHDYLEPLADLADERPVIFYDQLGCGRSARPDDPALWTMARSVQEVAAVRAALGLSQVHLFGNSWGGWLAMEYLLSGPRPPRSVTISSATASVPEWIEDAAALRAAMPADVQAVLDRHERHGWLTCPEYTAAVAAYYRRHVCRAVPWPACVERAFAGMNPAVYEAMWGASEFGPGTGVLKDFDVRGRLAGITIPALVTAGRYDEARPDRMRAVADELPRARLAIFENSSHMAFVEEQAAYVGALRAFLREHD